MIDRFAGAAAFLALAVFVCGPGPAAAPGHRSFDEKSALQFSQAAIGRQLGRFEFRDTSGRPLASDAFAGRPIVVNMVYTACSHYCPVTVQALSRGVVAAQDALGKDSFAVLTIGFDSRNDNPARMAAFARSQDVDLPNWHFLSADAETVIALSENIGFIFFPSAQGFDHLAQTTIIDAKGRIVRQVYGSDLTVQAIVEPLKGLRLGQPTSLADIAGIVDRVRLFCTLYDPSRDAYRFDWSVFTGIAAGLLSLAVLTGFLVHAVLQRRRVRS